MGFDILDFLWFLIKVLGSLTLVVFLINLLMNLIIDQLRKSERRKQEIQFNNFLIQTLEKEINKQPQQEKIDCGKKE